MPFIEERNLTKMAPEESQMDTFLQDAWDYKSCPASRSTTGGWNGAALILGFFELLLSTLQL